MSSKIEQSTGIIEKSDRSGRTRYTAQSKQEVLAAFGMLVLRLGAMASMPSSSMSRRREKRGDFIPPAKRICGPASAGFAHGG